MNAPLDHSRIPEPWVEPQPESKSLRWILYPLACALAVGAAWLWWGV